MSKISDISDYVENTAQKIARERILDEGKRLKIPKEKVEAVFEKNDIGENDANREYSRNEVSTVG